MADLRDFAALLTPSKGGRASQQLGLVWGVVTATSAGPPKTVSVTLHGGATSITGVRYLGWYTPSNNDVVALLANGPDLFCLGTRA